MLIIPSMFITGLAFLLLVIKHLLIEKRISQLKALIVINNNGFARINGHWRSLPDNGKDFMNEEHLFTSDLDIFGDNSLFQRINTAHTDFGRHALAAKLSTPAQPPSNLYQVQCAILEQAANVKFRQGQ
ncbi:hypothetical protein [Photobacterium proteolyticum]|uniref:hypothetical protein n=1 Tax=Photobacterium proteolyticum TaxID=1903952 RepID=UPI00111523D3|nr:hypothetical protein [Photobacterium proteolyticum]